MRTLRISLIALLATLLGAWVQYLWNQQYQKNAQIAAHRDSFALAWVQCVMGEKRIALTIDKITYEIKCKVLYKHSKGEVIW